MAPCDETSKRQLFAMWFKQMLTKSGRLCARALWSFGPSQARFSIVLDIANTKACTQNGKTKADHHRHRSSNHFVFAYHTCISQWSQCSVLHPLNLDVEIHDERVLCMAHTPWRSIVCVFAWVKSQINKASEYRNNGRISKPNQNRIGNKCFANALLSVVQNNC